MSDHDPIVLRRLFALRQFPMFAGVDLAELAVVAENADAVTLPPGTIVAVPGTPLSALQLVLDGQIAMPGFSSVWGPHQAFGLLEVLATRELAAPAVAVSETHTLQLRAADVEDVFEDNFGLLTATLRELATRLIAVDLPRARAIDEAFPAAPLGLVDRLIILRHQVPFAAARLQPLAMLAYAATEVSVPADEIVVRAGELARHATLVLGGTLQARGPDRAVRVIGPGEGFGVFETLAGRAHHATIETLTPVRVLQFTSTAIFDVLEDHTDVGLAMLATFARALLDVGPPDFSN